MTHEFFLGVRLVVLVSQAEKEWNGTVGIT